MVSGFLEMTPCIKLAEDEEKIKPKTKQLRTELHSITTLSC